VWDARGISIDVRHFRSFVAVAEEGRIGGAATRLSVVQLATERPGSAIGGKPAQSFDVFPCRGDADLYVRRALLPHASANDLAPRTAAVLATTQRP
jgi:hypothetical protein